jgi:RNA polymerase sigma-70 factor (ECF subfamily)
MAREIAEELVSDALFTIWEKRKDLSHVQNMETYLFVMVKNKSINYTKQFSNYRYVYLEESGGHELININDPGKELERRELMLKMDKAIEKLPRQCKIIFSLVKEEGLKYKDVAQILDISPRTVETQLVRALKKLDKVLTSYGFHKASRKRKSNSFSTLRSMMVSIFC